MIPAHLLRLFRPSNRARRLFPAAAAALALLGAAPARALVPTLNVPWGVVSQEDLRDRPAIADSNAEAVILADVGRYEMTHDDYRSFFHVRRVKLLRDSAYEKWGTVRIFYYGSRGAERVERLRAHTLTLNPDGTTKSIDLPASDIFDEKVSGGLRQKKFTFPGLTPGCIIEYEYELRSGLMALPNWQFQMSEPVCRTALSVTVPSNCRLLLWRRGDQGRIEEARVDHPWPTTMWDTDRAARYGLKLVEYRWSAQDMPALRAEPYLSTLDNFLSSLQVIPNGFDWGEVLPVDHANSWKKEARWLDGLDAFGGAMQLGAAGKERVKLLTRTLSDTAARVQALYDHVRTTIRCSGRSGIYSGPAQETFDAHAGSVAEVNLLFVAMLRQAGVPAWPALISTRDNGEPYMQYPLLGQFNYVVAAVERNGGYDLLDPTDPQRPAGLLASRALAHYAWVVRDDEPEWIEIPSDASTSTRLDVTARLDPRGRATGRVTGVRTGYSAVAERTNWKEVGGDSTKCRQHFVETLFPDYAGATIERFAVAGMDSVDRPLGLNLDFSDVDAAVPAGRALALKPFFLAGMARNPFVRPTRAYPVDLPHAIREHYRLELDLPAGWTCPPLPADVTVVLPNHAGQLTRHCELIGSRLVYERDLAVGQLKFDVPDYARLRGFFDRVAETAGEEIVLTEENAARDAGDGVRR